MVREYKWLADAIALNYYREYNLNLHDLDDLKQEGYIKLWKIKDKYNDSFTCSFKTFATKCLKRHMYRYLQTKIINKVDFDNNFDFDNVGAVNNMDLRLMYLDITKILDRMEYEKLEDRLSILYRLEGDTYNEIANSLNSDYETVKYSVFKTIKRIQRILNLKECC